MRAAETRDPDASTDFADPGDRTNSERIGAISRSSVATVLAALLGLVLGVIAQLLRQISGPAMELGAATAPWVTIGFLAALLGGRMQPSTAAKARRAILIAAAYLVAWLASYHIVFAIRESIGAGDAWRETAPWLLLVGPAAILFGFAASKANRGGLWGDVCLALPIAWSLPELVSSWTLAWGYVLVVFLPTMALALSPPMVVSRRDMKWTHLLMAWSVFAAIGATSFPLLRGFIRS